MTPDNLMPDAALPTLKGSVDRLMHAAINYGESAASDAESAKRLDNTYYELKDAIDLVEKVCDAIRDNGVVMGSSGGETRHMRIRDALFDLERHLNPPK